MSKITETDFREYSKLIEEGHSQRSACLILGLNRSTIQRYIKGVLEDEAKRLVDKKLDNQFLIDHNVKAENIGSTQLKRRKQIVELLLEQNKLKEKEL